MAPVVRWLAAVAAGVIVFEGLDTLGGRESTMAWLTLVSPLLAGAVAGWAAGGGVLSQLLAAATMTWARIGADRVVGLAHGVTRPPEVELVVAAVFGLPWMGLAVVGGLLAALARRSLRR